MSPRSENPEQGRILQQRLLVMVLVIVGCCAVLTGGLAYRQLIKADDMRETERRQNFRRIVMPGPRGNIYDREGRLLVGNRPLFSAVIYLNDLRREFREEYRRLYQARRATEPVNREQLSLEARERVVGRYMNLINGILDRDEAVATRDIERHFGQSLLLPFPLLTDLSPEEYARLVEQLPVDSPIQVITDSARYYPYAASAAHTLGFVSSTEEIQTPGLPGEELLTFRFEGKVGRSGLESSFDRDLQGHSGGEIWSVDPGGFQYERVDYRPPVKGRDLQITLDVDLQQAAEKAFGDKIGAVVALDVMTGEVLALASFPNFDLNQLSPVLTRTTDQQIREKGAWLNRATQGLYPPGSTFKLVTAIAGLRTGVTNAQRIIHCPGYYQVGRRTFHCNNRAGHGDEDLVGAIRDSCNVYFYKTGLEMGIEPIAAEARRFGLDQSTGIELAETRGMLVPDPIWKKEKHYGEPWFDGDTANVSIGQGALLVTPLQMACFVSSVARGETRTQPTLLVGGVESPPTAHHGETIGISPAGYALVREGMRQAGATGTARLAAPPGFTVAGKTGTAQVRKDGQPTTLAWFVGFAPAEAPRIAVVVMVEGVPAEDTRYGGGATAAPIAREVFAKYLQKQQVLPQKNAVAGDFDN